MKRLIHKPIFIIGCGRSGTTIFNDILCSHKDLAWFSNYSNRYYPIFPFIASSCAFNSLPGFRQLLRHRRPRPSEGYNLWNWCHPVPNSPSDPPLTEIDITQRAYSKCRRIVADHLRFSGKKRFVNKNTRNTRRIRYLNKIFPDARFVHVIRDGRAVVASLLNVYFWKDLQLWYEGYQKRDKPRVNRKNDIERAARLWVEEVNIARDARDHLLAAQYREIRYEDFVNDPVSTMQKTCVFLELEWTPEIQQHITEVNIRNLNHRYRDRLTKSQIRVLNEMLQPVFNDLGYTL